MNNDNSGKLAQITNPNHLWFGVTGKLLRVFNTSGFPHKERTYRLCSDGNNPRLHRGEETFVTESDVTVID